ncbi:hypothetical protein AC244_19905 [Ensifer adhaerens]|uniref:Uncharacterized protein n=1 Tax=Ensifer adhaerens TaxID=106592 RepID=A0A0L8BQ54_ENSAD|nr:hypothetical protein AC244_19905 [Ensifer adhaerens]
MNALLKSLGNTDGADRADPDAGTTPAATVDVHLRQKRPTGPRPKADRLLRTGIAAGLAGDVVFRQAAVGDGNDMGKARRALQHKYRLRAGPCAIAAERAFTA